MKTVILAGALGLSLACSSAIAQEAIGATPAGGAASPIDRQFAGQASAANTFEVRSSQMALRKSHDPVVRDLARWMIESHMMAERKLQGAASYADGQGAAGMVETPTTSATLSDLGALDGAAFDKAYVDGQIAGHEMAARQTEDYMQTGSYGPLLNYGSAMLPEVEDHLAHFEALKASMSRGARS